MNIPDRQFSVPKSFSISQSVTAKPRGVGAFCFLLAMLVSSHAFAAAPIEQDLLASYAASYASSVGGEDNAQVIIANTVAGNNTIQDQSGTGARMKIAGPTTDGPNKSFDGLDAGQWS